MLSGKWLLRMHVLVRSAAVLLCGTLLLSCASVGHLQPATQATEPSLPQLPGFETILTLHDVPVAVVFGEAPPDCQITLVVSAIGTTSDDKAETFETYKHALDSAGWVRLGGHETIAHFRRGTAEWIEVTVDPNWEERYGQHKSYTAKAQYKTILGVTLAEMKPNFEACAGGTGL
jgi:hypothetical protein